MNPKYFVVKGIGGMGNRILALLDGILYALLSGRELIVDWGDMYYSSDGSNSFPRFFAKPEAYSTESILTSRSVHPAVWLNNLDKEAFFVTTKIHNIHLDNRWVVRNPVFWNKFSTDLKKLDYSEDILVRWSVYSEIHKLRRHFKGEFSSLSHLSNETILRRLVAEELVPSENIQSRVDSYKERYFGESKTIGVHIRYTDRKTSLSKHHAALERILEHNPKSTIFLATDNKSVEEEFKSIYGDSKVVSTQKWYPQSGSLHKSSECVDKCENGIEALTDIYLLASCHYLVFDQNSTFGYIAKLLSKIPESNLFDVSKRDFSRNLEMLIRQLDAMV